MDAIMIKTNIAHREVFDALVSGKYENLCLFSYFVNGEPAFAICAVDEEDHEGQCLIIPLFVDKT
jgi:hypothetical protein